MISFSENILHKFPEEQHQYIEMLKGISYKDFDYKNPDAYIPLMDEKKIKEIITNACKQVHLPYDADQYKGLPISPWYAIQTALDNQLESAFCYYISLEVLKDENIHEKIKEYEELVLFIRNEIIPKLTNTTCEKIEEVRFHLSNIFCKK